MILLTKPGIDIKYTLYCICVLHKIQQWFSQKHNYASEDKDMPTKFAEKLDHLFKTFTKSSGEEHDPAEIQAATQQAAERGILEKPVTSSYIWRLRAGTAANPTYHIIKALAWFFKIDAGYFFRDEDDEAFDLEGARADQRQELAQSIAMRARDLGPDGMEALHAMLLSIKQVRGEATAGQETESEEHEE